MTQEIETVDVDTVGIKRPDAVRIHEPQPLGQSDAELARPFSHVPIVHESFSFMASLGSTGPKQLSFLGKSFLINNLSGQWWFWRQWNSYIAPYQAGLIVNIPSGCELVEFIAETPPNALGSSPATNQVLSVTAWSKHQPPSPGICYTRGAALFP